MSALVVIGSITLLNLILSKLPEEFLESLGFIICFALFLLFLTALGAALGGRC